MERFDPNMSTKNIGFIHWDTYLKRILDSVQDVISRMRWKLFFYKQKKKKPNQRNQTDDQNHSEGDGTRDTTWALEEGDWNDKYFGLKSFEEAPSDPDLKGFEEDLLAMVSKLKK